MVIEGTVQAASAEAGCTAPMSAYDAMAETALRTPESRALAFMERDFTYQELLDSANDCARALGACGVGAGDVVTIALPCCPQAVFAFYALNCLGAVANMVNPKATAAEIASAMGAAQSSVLFIQDKYYQPMQNDIRGIAGIRRIVVIDMADGMSKKLVLGYKLAEGRKIKKIRYDGLAMKWLDFLERGKGVSLEECLASRGAGDAAAIEHSSASAIGPEGITLTNGQLNALLPKLQETFPQLSPDDAVLAAVPLSYAFGLGVMMHAPLQLGATCVLSQYFSPKTFIANMLEYRCSHIAALPELFEQIIEHPGIAGKDLSFLKGVLNGEVGLSNELRERIDDAIAARHGAVGVSEGCDLV